MISTELFAFPMSFAQQRLWFLEQMNRHSASYNISGAVRLTGPLDIGALQQSLDVLVERHESLRTTFAFVENSPAQLIAEQMSIPLELISLDAATSWASISDRLDHEARRPFDLISGPLLRVALIRRSESEHVLLATMHHMISDGWSIQILLHELSTLYSANRAGRAAQLPELAIQYADFSVWQRDWLTGDVLDRQLAYWKQQLAEPSTLHLPTDYPRPAVQTFGGSVESWAVPAPLVERLQAVSRRERVTLFSLLLTAFQVLLHRYSGQDDILVGVPVASRHRTEIEHIIGFFANTLVVRADVAGNPTFSALLQQIHQTALDAYAHQDLPFEKLVEELHLERNLSYTPLFQVAFTFQDAPLQRLTMPGVDVEALPLHTGTAKFDLTLDIEATDSELRCVLEYNTDLFAPTTIARMAAHFQQLLAGIAADPGLRIGSLSLVATDERHDLLHGWNPPARHVATEGCLHTLFERQARQHPDTTAIVFGEQRISYGTLDQRANRLAHYLRRLGVGPDMLVGMYVERSPEMILGILGILKAGGAYVPLDPAYPSERLAFMLEDSQAALVLTTRHMARDLPDVPGRVICLDEIEVELAEYPAEPPALCTTSDNLAYIIYTSGSTGRPKGVGVTHANVLRLFGETDHWFRFDHHDVWTLFHSYAFDFSVWELWGALLYGGRLVVVPYEISRSPDAFYRLLAAEQVTVLNQTPSAFRQLIQVEEQALVEPLPLALRYVIFGGEALDPSVLKPWFERHGEQPQLINMYGITETTVHVTHRVITPADSATPHASPIGCPIPDLRIYLLDRYLNPVPVGVTGEIYVAGSGLARGYLKRPALTAERFIPDPFSGIPGARLYKTGDTARRLANGEIQYLGRIDAQVKIRGFRIELGEIDAVLREHPLVSTSLTMVREDAPGEKRLVAYVVAEKNQEPRTKNQGDEELGSRSPGGNPVLGSAELRQHLGGRLPDYMIPTAFVLLDTLPLTENGKINRAALPAPERSGTASELEYVAPQTPTEELLAAVWAKVLSLPRVGIHDNFFAVGGDSILSLQILAMAKQRGLSFSLQHLFQHPTIAELAQVIANDAWEQEDVHTEPLSLLTPEDRRRIPQGIEDAYPLAMLQAGTLYHMALAPESNIYHNTDSFHLRTKTPFDLALFQQAVAAVVARHSILRTGFDLTSYSEPLQLVHARAVLPVVLEDVRQLSFEEQERLIAELIEQEKQHRFDLNKPTLLRFFVHLRTDDSFQFTLTECHSIIDGWSLHSTLVEMFQCYFALLKHEPLPDLRPLSVSFRDFVALERKALTSTEHEQYWLRKLDGASLLQIPRLHPVPAGDVEQGPIFTETIVFPAALHEGLQRIVRTMAVPLKSILLAAHIKVMSILGGQTDVLLGVGMNGRPETLDGAQLRGLFINAVPFRLKLAPGSWLDLIQATFATEQEIMPHRRYPLAAIQQKCGFQRVYEVRFNYLHFHVLYELAEALPDLQELGAIRSEGSEATLAVHFQVHPLTGHLTVDLDYDSAQLSQEQVARIGTYYTAIIAAMVADPQQQQHTFSPLAADEQRQLLTDWSASQRRSDYPATACLHQLFEEQAARTPDLIAVVAGEQRLSYADLNARSNQLAHALRRREVGPETHVALYLDRSVEIIVAVLGILKAGAAYVPLDPDQPPARLSAQLDNSRPPVLITHSSLLDRLPDYAGSILCLDRDQLAIEREPHTNPAHTSTAQNIAYVIYTSGSTGTPKGVAVTHQSLVNYTWFMCRTLDLAPGLNFATVSTISADLGNTVVFSSLLSGGCLHVLDFDVATNGRMFADYLAQHQIDVLKIVPSHLRALIEAADGEHVLPRRNLILGGEALSSDFFTQLCERARGCAIINHYGPTETTIGSLVHLPGTPLPTPGSTIPIGRPIANTQVYLLDRHLLPVPAGVVGELYIGGDGVARGYLDRPDLTAERFIPDPFGRSGTRLYKTGDVARHLPDGTIQFVGRADQQVKIRGFRIELSEIESVLRQHEAVREAVVIAREDAPGEKRLVAYVVKEQRNKGTKEQSSTVISPSPVADEAETRRGVGKGDAGGEGLSPTLRAFLAQRLPEYMLPSAFVLLDALPLTPNGKLDRRALPVPDTAQRDTTTAYSAPRTV
ncbi:MAG TPA: amino acid adenylation domain-containing protein, partial [Herpetosiphonaceae bacterium]